MKIQEKVNMLWVRGESTFVMGIVSEPSSLLDREHLQVNSLNSNEYCPQLVWHVFYPLLPG